MLIWAGCIGRTVMFKLAHTEHIKSLLSHHSTLKIIWFVFSLTHIQHHTDTEMHIYIAKAVFSILESVFIPLGLT